MRTLQVGIIGQGRSGRNIHAQWLIHVPEKFRIAAVVDPLADRRDRAAKEYGCDTYADYRDLFKRNDLDLIVNATPSHLHVPVTREALETGFNVLCEKPLARRAADVDDLIAVSRRTGKLLAIYQQSRFAPYFEQVRKVVDSGVLGRIVMVKVAFNGFSRRWDWQTLQDMNGGNLLNTGPHPLDQALQLFGTDQMPEVWCRFDRVNTFGDAEDHVKLLLSGKDRPTIDLEISSCCAYPVYTYQVYGSCGGLSGNMTHIDWKYFKPEEAPPRQLIREPLPGPSYCSEKLAWYEESWDVPESQKDLFNSMAARFYDNLYDALTTGAPLVVQPEHVRLQVAVIEECHRQNPLSRL
ncbi:MAG: Gfo/Idh/MocA family oxidoreductase [Kiritimatiellaeota bacterium]|nr:Gfo/Idh/MocA family oxidoreductase [Kiritimatiellota bacterium]